MILVPLSPRGQRSAPLVPAKLIPPNEAKLVLQAFAQGDQIYTCKEQNGQYSWALKGPEAQFLDQDYKPLGRHFAGPSWELNDKSAVTGKIPKRQTLGRRCILLLMISETREPDSNWKARKA